MTTPDLFGAPVSKTVALPENPATRHDSDLSYADKRGLDAEHSALRSDQEPETRGKRLDAAKQRQSTTLTAGDTVVCATPPATFAEAIALLEQSGTVPPDRMATFRRDVRWVEARQPRPKDGSSPPPLPCNTLLLRPILEGIKPGAHQISAKRYSNIRVELAAIQRKTGWLPPRMAQVQLTSQKWAHGLALIDTSAVSAMFRAFAVFCEAQALEPDQIGPDQVEQYRDHLTKYSTKLNVNNTVEALRYGWNHLCRQYPDWGGLPLPKKRSPRNMRLDLSTITPDFYADLEAYLKKLAKPDLFAAGFPTRTSPATIDSRRDIYILSASILLQNGWSPSEMTSIHTLTKAKAVEAILTAYHGRNCGSGNWTLGAEATAAALKTAAHQWGRHSPDELAEIDRICRTVKAPKSAFPKKVRERLAQFDDRSTERRFWELPKEIWKDALKMDREGRPKHAADLAKYAVALAIAFDKPLRVQNLSGLDLGLDFTRDKKGRIEGIRIEGERTTKNAPIIEGSLSDSTQRMLNDFIIEFRPRLLVGESSALFPGMKSAACNKTGFANQVRRLIDRYLGATVNVHLIRALIGTVILDEDPRNVVVAQRVLDHRSSTTTLRAYAQQRGRAVQGEYAELMRRRIKKLTK